MTYKKAFPDFELDVEIPAGFNDTSWRNDACPSWENPAGSMKLFVDYQQPEDRECGGGRFTLAYLDQDGTIENEFTTDDWAEMTAQIEKAMAL
jgi:hypothetical protein